MQRHTLLTVSLSRLFPLAAAGLIATASPVWARQPANPQPPPKPSAPAPTSGTDKPAQAPAPRAATPQTVAAPPVVVPADYVIGADDVLAVVVWKEQDMSTDVVVRPDGMISLPLLNDVHALGMTPEQLRADLTTRAAKFVADPTVSVVVKAINSRKVFVTGMVGKPGPYPISAPITVLQLLSMAGGVQEFADSKNIQILRTEDGRQVAYRFNYSDVKKGKNLKQNIQLKPGDTVIVP